MEKSESITNLTKALALFHVKVGKIGKDAKNPFFKSNYASLPHILTEVRDPLQESGLVISQFPNGDGLTTMLIHAESGEFISSTYTLQVVKINDPQAQGSAISYARRYAISSVLNLQIDDDDAERATAPARQPANNEKPWLNSNSDAWAKVIDSLKNGYTMQQVLKKYNISKVNQVHLMEASAN
jgi:hypothetical protein